MCALHTMLSTQWQQELCWENRWRERHVREVAAEKQKQQQPPGAQSIKDLPAAIATALNQAQRLERHMQIDQKVLGKPPVPQGWRNTSTYLDSLTSIDIDAQLFDVLSAPADVKASAS